MPLFETTVKIDQERVAQLVLLRWGLKLANALKASQNHTFSATNEQGAKFAVRVTPDPEKKHQQRITDELTFVQFCCTRGLNHLCAPVKPTMSEDQSVLVRDQDLLVCVFQWAHGEPVNFFELTWLNDEALITAWGKFFAELHAISRLFEKEEAQVAKRIQSWRDIHHGVMKKITLHSEDEAEVNNETCYGVIHGDLNTSNQYFDRQNGNLSVFDTDQVQRGFFEWDLAQAIFGVALLKEAGMPCSGDPVPQADPKAFEQALIKGYEKVAGEGTVNLNRLQRMVDMKRQFYRLFCTQAIEEGAIPSEMQPFIHFIAKSLTLKPGAA